jgi:hypothetical protein
MSSGGKDCNCKGGKLRRATAMTFCWQRGMIRVREKLESDGDCRRRGDAVTTHIIIKTLAAKHGDTPTAKLQDEKGQGIECHGWERRRVISPSARIYQPISNQIGKIEAPNRAPFAVLLTTVQYTEYSTATLSVDCVMRPRNDDNQVPAE